MEESGVGFPNRRTSLAHLVEVVAIWCLDTITMLKSRSNNVDWRALEESASWIQIPSSSFA